MADNFDEQYMTTRRDTRIWQQAQIERLSTVAEGAGTLEDPKAELAVDAPTNEGTTLTELKLSKPPTADTVPEEVKPEPIAHIEGKTADGRPIRKNTDGSISTEKSITVTDERINGGKPTNIPSMFGGNELTEEAAIQRIVEAGGKDPETGRALPAFDTVQEAVDAAIKRSEELGKENDKPKRKEFTVDTPEVQELRTQAREQLAKMSSGEAAVEEVGKAGRKVAEAIHPGIVTAGRALGLDEEGADALATGFVEFIGGLPGKDEGETMAGIETALAALPMVGAMVKSGKAGAKAAEEMVRVFHGSPHKFDKFDMGKIGSGEGAQAFGHGLYFAEDPKVAESYAKKLADPWDGATRQGEFLIPGKGNIYHVDIPKSAVERMLDWDKPLSQQPESVRKALEDSGLLNELRETYKRGDDPLRMTGAEFYRGLAETEAEASERLKVAGIPGLRYLDGGSRNKGTGTSNFVVFDDSLPRIDVPSAFQRAMDTLKDERGSFQPIPGGGKAPKEKLPGVSTPVTWEEAVKIDESTRAFEDRLKTFSDRLSTQRRGVRSDVQVTADSMSPEAISLETFLDLPPGTILKDSDVVAAKRMFKDLAEPVRLMAKWVAENPNDQQAFLSLLEHLPKVDEAVTRIAGAYAESGRTQRLLSQKLPTGGNVVSQTAERVRIADPYIQQWLAFFQQQDQLAAMGSPAMTKDKFVQVMASMQSPEEFMAAAKALSKPTKWDMFMEYWINGLLSGPQTHATNVLSNAATIAWGIPERALASMFSRSVRPSESLAMLGGILEAQGDAWRLAWQAFKKEESQLGAGKLEGPARAITADALELTGVPGRAVDFLGSIIRLPGRALLASDDYFKSIAFRAELRALAKRESFKQVMESGLTGQAAKNRMRQIEQNILTNPPDSIEDAAKEFASYVTFTRDLGEAGQKVQAAFNAKLRGVPLGRIVMPFIRTPTNIFKYAGERTPLGLLSGAVWDEIFAGGERRALALAKLSLGAMTMSYMGMWAAEGIITGGGPKDKQLRQEMMATGWQPYSIKVGDTYYRYSRIEPIGSLFGMAADAADLFGQLSTEESDKLAAFILVAIQRNIAQKTFIKGLAGTLNAVSSQDVNVVQGFIEKELPTILPFSTAMGQTTRELDPVMREVHSFIDALKAKTPGLSDSLPPRRNLWGEAIHLEGGLGPDMISPFYSSSVKDDKVSQELVRLELPISMPSKQIDGVPLTPQEYDAFVVLQGSKPIIGDITLKDRLADLMKSDLYKRSSDGPDGGKAALIRQWVSSYRDMAKHVLDDKDLSQQYLQQDFPELRDQLVTARDKKSQMFNAPAIR